MEQTRQYKVLVEFEQEPRKEVIPVGREVSLTDEEAKELGDKVQLTDAEVLKDVRQSGLTDAEAIKQGREAQGVKVETKVKGDNYVK